MKSLWRCIDTSLAFELFQEILTPDVLQLGAATPATDHLPVAKLNRLMAKALREHPNAAHSYNVPTGYDVLRAEIAKRMLDAGCSIHPDHILMTNGVHYLPQITSGAAHQPSVGRCAWALLNQDRNVEENTFVG